MNKIKTFTFTVNTGNLSNSIDSEIDDVINGWSKGEGTIEIISTSMTVIKELGYHIYKVLVVFK